MSHLARRKEHDRRREELLPQTTKGYLLQLKYIQEEIQLNILIPCIETLIRLSENFELLNTRIETVEIAYTQTNQYNKFLEGCLEHLNTLNNEFIYNFQKSPFPYSKRIEGNPFAICTTCKKFQIGKENRYKTFAPTIIENPEIYLRDERSHLRSKLLNLPPPLYSILLPQTKDLKEAIDNKIQQQLEIERVNLEEEYENYKNELTSLYNTKKEKLYTDYDLAINTKKKEFEEAIIKIKEEYKNLNKDKQAEAQSFINIMTPS
jgi:hypothetical protein